MQKQAVRGECSLPQRLCFSRQSTGVRELDVEVLSKLREKDLCEGKESGGGPINRRSLQDRCFCSSTDMSSTKRFEFSEQIRLVLWFWSLNWRLVLFFSPSQCPTYVSKAVAANNLEFVRPGDLG